MGLGWLLVPAIGGYWFLTHWHYTRYHAVRESGYHILFRSGLTGVFLFALARAITLLLDNFLPQVDRLWTTYFPDPYSDAAILSVILGFILPWLVNRFCDEKRIAQKVAGDSGDFVELLIADSIENQQLVELSLRSGKVYIGLALRSGIGRGSDPDVEIVPLASGYRNKDTQELKIATYYASVIEESIDNSLGYMSDEDFRVVIPVAEIVSARLFFPEAYELFQDGRSDRTNEPAQDDV
jgi:hypothetical protein